MPWVKTGPDEYTSPSGNKINGAQLRLYKANGNSFPKKKKKKRKNLIGSN